MIYYFDESIQKSVLIVKSQEIRDLLISKEKCYLQQYLLILLAVRDHWKSTGGAEPDYIAFENK